MKRCKLCNAPLKHIGTIRPAKKYESNVPPKLSPEDGIVYTVIYTLLGGFISYPLWENYYLLSSLIMTAFMGIGLHFQKKPRKFYRCSKCGAEFYGHGLLFYERDNGYDDW